MKGLTIATPPRSEWFPIGSIYISVNTTNPGTIFGGTWEQIKDKFILCSGDTYSNGSTGGSATHLHGTQGHTLTSSEIPSTEVKAQYYANAGKADTGGSWVGDNQFFHTAGRNIPTTSFDNMINGWASDKGGSILYPLTVRGGGGSHNHGNTTSTSTLPPYLAVTVWKRVA